MARVRKCTRCSTKLNWDRTYCPMCGGSTIAIEDDRPKPPLMPRPSTPVQSETPPPIPPAAPVQEAAAAVAQVAEPPHKVELPDRPAPSIPGLEYLDDEPEQKPRPAAAAPTPPPAPAPAPAPAAPAPAPEKLDLLEPLELSSDISGASFGGFTAGPSAPAAKAAPSGEKLDISSSFIGGTAAPTSGPIGEKLELSGDLASMASASMTSSFGDAKPAPAAPAPQEAPERPLSIADEPAPSGEFLKMFPDAKPE